MNHFYEVSDLSLKTYFECIGLLASRGYYNLALRIIKDKITMENIDIAIKTFNNSIKPWHKVDYDCYNKVKEVLEEIQSNVLINLFIDKEPYIKTLTDDEVINLTGQSGSGKSTYAENNFNTDNYLVVDTDDIFNEIRFEYATGINKELEIYFRNKYKELPSLSDDFDLIYNEIINYCKNNTKTLVIDCAQFHCIKDIKLLKGKIIIIRTCIDNCYIRTIERYKNLNENYTEEELNKYNERKKGIYSWYKRTNEFINNII